MTAFEQLESLNPVPELRGNPGPHMEPQRSASRRRLAQVLAAAAAIVAIGAIVVAIRDRDPIELQVAAQEEEALAPTPESATPTPVPARATDSPAEIAPSPELTRGGSESEAAIARLIVPAISLDAIVVDDVTVTALRKGPGHYPETALPGQAGNAAIAGHRTTYGALFHRLDELAIGDSIFVTTQQGVFEYQVDEQRIVDSVDVSVLEDAGDNRLTLTTGHPKYINNQRLIVVASLVGEPAAPVTFAQFPLVAQIEWDDEDDIPDISEQSFRDTQPYFSFIGNTDVLASAAAFVESQFGDWSDGVQLEITQEVDRRAAVRWTDTRHGTGGWIIVFFADGINHVWNMTMDGVHTPMYQSQTGGRGFARANRAFTLEVLRPVPFSASRDHDEFVGEPLSAEPLAITQIGQSEPETLVTFAVAQGERPFQEVRMIVRNEQGEQVGGVASSLALPALTQLAVVTSAANSEPTRKALEASPEVIAGPLGWDRWQSVGELAAFAPEFAPTEPNEVPNYELTMFALRAVATPQQYQDQVELLQSLSDAEVLFLVPTFGSEPPPMPDLPPRADSYVVDGLPSVDICRHLQAGGWARPEVQINDDRQVFDTPEEARDSAEETATGHVVEFKNSDDSVIGFIRPAEFNPWWFASLAVVERVDDGWVLDRWERATC